MRFFGFTRPARCACLLALLTASACGKAVPQDNPSAALIQPDAVVAELYKKVLAHHPIAGMGDPKVFGPYLSKELRQRFDDNAACFADWHRQNPDTTDKPPFDQLEMGLYSGGTDRSSPQSFRIEKTGTGKDGSARVTVTLTYAEPTFKLLWHVAVIVVRENGSPRVDDVIYLADKDQPEEYRLSGVLSGPGCKGARWVGAS